MNTSYYRTLQNDANFAPILAKYEEFITVSEEAARQETRKLLVEQCGLKDQDALAWLKRSRSIACLFPKYRRTGTDIRRQPKRRLHRLSSQTPTANFLRR